MLLHILLAQLRRRVVLARELRRRAHDVIADLGGLLVHDALRVVPLVRVRLALLGDALQREVDLEQLARALDVEVDVDVERPLAQDGA